MKNVISFDVEDYFQVGAFADRVNKSQWDQFPSRVEANTKKILELLAVSGRQGTFFTLGWVAEKFPALVRAIAEAGHEVACHSHEHRRVFDLTPHIFREDTLRAKRAIEDACGRQIFGYRAPNFSITDKSLWALEILAELGFRYDSSIFPVDHPDYGMLKSPRFPFVVSTNSGPLVEFPMTTLELGSRRSPLSGGAYLRLLPYWYTRWGLRYVNVRESQPFCVYLHPWELDTEQPRLSVSLSARLRHYIGLRGTESKLGRLLKDFEFQQMNSLIEELSGESSLPVSNPLAEIPLCDLRPILN
jgi:polysaccharide deacetylase family protein (PEP-CTERM system associated)